MPIMAKPNQPQQPPAPRRYDEMVFDDTSSQPSGGSAYTPAKERVTSNAPASALSGGVSKPVGDFGRNVREDDGRGKPDAPQRKSNKLDPISHHLDFGLHEERVSFSWHCDSAGRGIPFSRRYWDEDVLVDLFQSDSPWVREEIVLKREAIAAHNERAKDNVAMIRQAAEKRAATRFAAAKALNRPHKTQAEYIEEEFQAGYIIAKRSGDVPFAYAPITNNLRDIDGAALRKGAILDLPLAGDDDWAPVGMGVRSSKHE